jgi:23S rRNA G2445 N2-methylase RlmL
MVGQPPRCHTRRGAWAPVAIEMDFGRSGTIRLTCTRGLAPWLEREVTGFGLVPLAVDDTGVEVAGTLRDCMALNLRSRIATYVLFLLERFTCRSPDELYKRVAALPWEDAISPDERLSVVSAVEHPSITDSRFANRRVKDAIVDRIARRRGRRPDSGPDRENAVVNLYWRGDDGRVYLNTTGRKLSDRGYRRIPCQAPMRETLAAAVVLETGFDGTAPLVNPMCGSGTLAIEGALLASGRAPGLLRSNFGFAHVIGFDDSEWQTIRREAHRLRAPGPPVPIVATDIDAGAVEAARKNALTAGVEQLIEFRVCDFAETPMPASPGVVVFNPGYGERVGEVRELEATYARIGDFFKQRCAGWTGYIFTGNPGLAKKIGLRTSRRVPFFNAWIECRLLRYELYAGTRS